MWVVLGGLLIDLGIRYIKWFLNSTDISVDVGHLCASRADLALDNPALPPEYKDCNSYVHIKNIFFC